MDRYLSSCRLVAVEHRYTPLLTWKSWLGRLNTTTPETTATTTLSKIATIKTPLHKPVLLLHAKHRLMLTVEMVAGYRVAKVDTEVEVKVAAAVDTKVVPAEEAEMVAEVERAEEKAADMETILSEVAVEAVVAYMRGWVTRTMPARFIQIIKSK